MVKESAFGIDFGTTNTRVAYYDGERLRMVRLAPGTNQPYAVPTSITYCNGQPACHGFDALRQKRGAPPPRPLKWLLGDDLPVEIDGAQLFPELIVAEFLRWLKRLVEEAITSEPLSRAAVTIPVHYPPKARQQLEQAFRSAGIEVSSFYFEPIAAIYCSLAAKPVSGVTAVFDWGGGSLDVATVQISDGVAMTRQIDGWHRGGADFDRAICEQALHDFLLSTPDTQFTADVILDRMAQGRSLRGQAQSVKEQLTTATHALLEVGGFLGGANLSYTLTRSAFEALIESDVVGAMARLDRALHATGVSPRLVARLFLSGGTCNIPRVKEKLAQLLGDRIVTRLDLPTTIRHSGLTSDGTSDIGHATAMGAALLAVHGAQPVFSSSVGVRLAEATGDHFYPVFRAGEPLSFTTKEERFFISDASSGVARILICDQSDEVLQPGGRLLRVITVPIDKNECWLKVRFTTSRHLVLDVEATGVIAKADDLAPVPIQHLNLGFRLPNGATTT